MNRNPLFAAAILFSLFLSVLYSQKLWMFSTPEPPHIYYQALSKPENIYLGGKVVSDVSVREQKFGGKLFIFTMAVQRYWDGSGTEESTKGLVKIYAKNAPEDLKYGDEVVMLGDLESPLPKTNLGGYDARSYLRSQGIFAVFRETKESPFKLLSRNRGNFLKSSAFQTRRKLIHLFENYFPEQQAAFLESLVVGYREDLDDEIKEMFVATGTMHILAVSGFNIGFLCACVLLILKPLNRFIPRDLRLCLLIASIWFYCFVVGWQAPLVRASIMATCYLAALLLGRKARFLNIIGFSVILILLIQPYELFNLGFQLSYLSVIALSLFTPLFIQKPKHVPGKTISWVDSTRFYIAELFWVSFVCLVVTMPLTVQNFYIVTPLALVTNLFSVPLSFLIFFGAFLFVITGFMLPWVCLVFSKITSTAISVFFILLKFFERAPGAVYVTGEIETWLWVALIAGIIWLLYDKKIMSRWIRASLIVLLCANIFLVQDVLRYFRPMSMTMIDVGQGDSSYFEFPGKRNILVDTGPSGREVVSFLRQRGIRSLDAVFISHPQQDHVGGFEKISKQIQIKNVVGAAWQYDSHVYSQWRSFIQKNNYPFWQIQRGDSIAGFEDVQIETLHPSQEFLSAKDINEASVVLKLTYKKATILMTGDIGDHGIHSLIDSYPNLKTDILKVPHHGSKAGKNEQLWVNMLHPCISLINVGRHNPFGHPRSETLKVLDSVPDNQIFRTDANGAIQIQLNDSFESLSATPLIS